ncbi:hypothetical protein J2X31_003553 [Flavobacterium arsenatis]|uniref:Uncharacterized protein n=1 Tax=Flavobacterium arsenatis TaxID=1484332 RepID=A0ABU1TUJ8_9FLAO|nr:hypothetical protein [Flavobacterium arsenatis]MDR6969520.1 hypothetical protein [Flavobacterium arsenatis]
MTHNADGATSFDSLFQIQNDPVNGKVITITGHPISSYRNYSSQQSY